MSKSYITKEEAINQLYATIKTKFEQDGVLQEVRCLLQSKMVAMMKGKAEPSASLVSRPPGHISNSSGGGGGGETTAQPQCSDARMQLLHQLIMEYFHWHGFRYSAEMFAMESASESGPPVRECLEGVLGTFEHKNLPILLELVAQLMEQKRK